MDVKNYTNESLIPKKTSIKPSTDMLDTKYLVNVNLMFISILLN